MKRLTKKFAIISTLCIIFLATLGIDTKALQLVKSYDYDLNVLGIKTNLHNYQYKEMPSDVKFYYDHTLPIDSGWNYTRYRVIKYYKNSQGIY